MAPEGLPSATMTRFMHNIIVSLTLCLLMGFVWPLHAEEYDPVTDKTVKEILERGVSGVFYTWSPHMPLSIEGLSEIHAAGERLNLVVIPVLSSHANLAYARDRIEGRDVPDSVLRRSQASELIGRDLFVHAPAILVFDGGNFVSPVLPGFRYAADYDVLIGRFLASAER